MEHGRGQEALQRARGVHARRRVHPRRVRRARVLGGGRASARTAWPAPAAWAGRWPSGSSNGEPSLDLWHMDIRRFGRQYRSQRLHAGPRDRGLRHLLRHQVPQPRAPGRAAAAALAGLPAPGRAGRELRREVGLGAGQLVRAERRRTATSRCARAAGRARTGRRRSTPRRWRRASARASSTRPRSPRSRCTAPARSSSCSGLCAQRRRPRRPASVTYTQMLNRARRHRVRLHRHPAGRAPLPDRDRHRLRQPRPGLDPQAPARRRQRSRSATSPSAYACFGLWGPRAREILQPLTKTDLSQRGLPLHDARRRSRSATCRAWRCASPTSASSAGSSTARPSTAQALWDALWAVGPGARHARACGYRAIDALRIEKGYRVWGADITPEETPDEAGLAFAVKPDKGDFMGREALLASRARARRRAAPGLPRCWPTRGRSASAPSRCGSATRWSAASRPAATASPSSARIAYAYLPAGWPRPGDARSRSRCSASGWRAEVAAEPLWDPSGARIRA